MRRFFRNIWELIRQADWVLLAICLIASAIGCVVIASTTNHSDPMRYVTIQVGAVFIGVVFYLLVTAVDLEFVSEHRRALVIFNLFILALLIPFGEDFDSGNTSWLAFSFLPFSIQPAELCKITFVLIMASVMAAHQNRISSLRSIFAMGFQVALLVGFNWAVSSDAGVSLIFVFIALGMAFAGGVSLFWFVILGGRSCGLEFPYGRLPA